MSHHSGSPSREHSHLSQLEYKIPTWSISGTCTRIRVLEYIYWTLSLLRGDSQLPVIEEVLDFTGNSGAFVNQLHKD